MDAPLRLPLFLALTALAAAPAAAQPGASWTESGDVTITTFNNGQFGGREAEDVLETDVIYRIEIGDSGLVAVQESGSLRIEGIGNDVTPRELDEVEIKVGTFELNGSFVSGDYDLGVSIQSQFTDPSVGDMTVLLSEVAGPIFVGNGTLSAQASTLQEVTVNELGRAVLSGCQIGYVSAEGGGYTEIDASIYDGNGFFGGTMFVTNTTIAGSVFSVRDGVIQIGQSGAPVDWDAAGTITVGGNATTTELTITDATIESGAVIVRPTTDIAMQGASLWRSIGLFQIGGTPGSFEINSASRIQARTDLWLAHTLMSVGSGVGTDSRIDVDGDLDLGWTGLQAAGGTLTIEDGGYVDVDGTLTIRPLATLNLNGGTLRVGALDEQGTLNENGGTLIVPESAAAPVAALLALALVARHGRKRR